MTNEIKVMKEFIKEFHPFYTDEILDKISYRGLINIIEEMSNHR